MHSIRAEGRSVCTSESDRKTGNGYQRTGVCFLRQPWICHSADESGFKISEDVFLELTEKEGTQKEVLPEKKLHFSKPHFGKGSKEDGE